MGKFTCHSHTILNVPNFSSRTQARFSEIAYPCTTLPQFIWRLVNSWWIAFKLKSKHIISQCFEKVNPCHSTSNSLKKKIKDDTNLRSLYWYLVHLRGINIKWLMSEKKCVSKEIIVVINTLFIDISLKINHQQIKKIWTNQETSYLDWQKNLSLNPPKPHLHFLFTVNHLLEYLKFVVTV